MATPNDAAKTEQTSEQKPEGILRMLEDYGPDKVEEILASIRRAADNPGKGEWLTLDEFMERHGVSPSDARF